MSDDYRWQDVYEAIALAESHVRTGAIAAAESLETEHTALLAEVRRLRRPHSVAYQRGAVDMRERAAAVCEEHRAPLATEYERCLDNEDAGTARILRGRAGQCAVLARAIRALPLAEEE